MCFDPVSKRSQSTLFIVGFVGGGGVCVRACVRACVCVRVNVPNGDRIDCSRGRHSHRSFKGKGTLVI